MKRKNLAIFINSLEYGGGQKIASILVEKLREEFNLYLVLLYDSMDYKIPDDVQTVVLGKKKRTFFSIIKNIYAYKKFCKEKKIDFSLSLLTQPNYIAAITKIFGNKSKVILSEHTYQSLWRANEKVYSSFKRFILNFLYNKADKIVTVSKKINQDLRQNFGIKQDKLVTIYNPYKVKNISNLSHESVDDIDFEGKFTFITVGTLYHVKNQELLIKAFSKIDHTHAQLLIVGDGELKSSLKLLAKDLNVESKVKFLGFRNNPFKYVEKSDCFVLSSNNEGLPNVIIEALACGTSVVSTDCISGPREILAPGTSLESQLLNDIEFAEFGVLVPIKSEQLLTKALSKIMTDRSLQQTYQSKALNRASFFDADISIKNYINTIHSA